MKLLVSESGGKPKFPFIPFGGLIEAQWDRIWTDTIPEALAGVMIAKVAPKVAPHLNEIQETLVQREALNIEGKSEEEIAASKKVKEASQNAARGIVNSLPRCLAENRDPIENAMFSEGLKAFEPKKGEEASFVYTFFKGNGPESDQVPAEKEKLAKRERIAKDFLNGSLKGLIEDPVFQEVMIPIVGKGLGTFAVPGLANAQKIASNKSFVAAATNLFIQNATEHLHEINEPLTAKKDQAPAVGKPLDPESQALQDKRNVVMNLIKEKRELQALIQNIENEVKSNASYTSMLTGGSGRSNEELGKEKKKLEADLAEINKKINGEYIKVVNLD